MADFDKVRFPILHGLTAIGGPGFLTSVSTMASGKESRIQWWELERGKWVISYVAKLPSEWMPLLAFFRVISKGMANTCRFKDFMDFVCLPGEGFFIDDEEGSPVGKQMVKRYTFYGLDGTPYTYDRVISKPVLGTITTDAAGLDYSRGVASSGTTWSGEFDVWVRINNDDMRNQVINRNPIEGLIITWDDIELVEVIHEDL